MIRAARQSWCRLTSSIVVNIATGDKHETVTFGAARFRPGHRSAIYTLNLPDELTAQASGTADLGRLCWLAAHGRLDGQIEYEGSWRRPDAALTALLERRIGGKAVPAHRLAGAVHLPARSAGGWVGPAEQAAADADGDAADDHGADGEGDL
jgi:hypothetical protein